MIKSIAKLIFTIWQSRQTHYGHGKPWKSKKRKRYKHGPTWDHRGYPPYGHDYGYLSYHRPRGVRDLIIDATLRRLLHRR